MELHVVLKEIDIRHYRHRVAEIFSDFFGNDYATHFMALSNRLLYPAHITGQLSNRIVGTSCTLQFKHDKPPLIVNGQYVNQPNRVVVADQIVQSFRQQCRLVPVLSLYMQKNTRSELRVFFLTENRLFTQSRSCTARQRNTCYQCRTWSDRYCRCQRPCRQTWRPEYPHRRRSAY